MVSLAHSLVEQPKTRYQLNSGCPPIVCVLSINSFQSGDSYNVWGSNTAGDRGTLLLSGQTAPLVNLPDLGSFSFYFRFCGYGTVLLRHGSVVANRGDSTRHAVGLHFNSERPGICFVNITRQNRRGNRWRAGDVVMFSGPRHVCPTSGSKGLFRVSRRGFLDMFVTSVTGMRPYFCDRCGWKKLQASRACIPKTSCFRHN
jgi:hypothetical protein